MTRDDVLICRHEPLLSNTTNADELFPDRITTYVRPGKKGRRWRRLENSAYVLLSPMPSPYAFLLNSTHLHCSVD
jgi:hypothetical protein